MNVEVAEGILIELSEIFDSRRIPFWLTFGTLLGIMRDGHIIEGDDDIDIMILTPSLLEPLEEAFKENGFRCVRFKPNGYTASWALYKDGIEAHVLFQDRDGDEYVTPAHEGLGRRLAIGNYDQRFPSYHLDVVCYYQPHKVEYRIPSDYNKFLTNIYGDWTKPISSEEWKLKLQKARSMPMHFIFTGGEFIYPYRLAIESAIKTQSITKLYLNCTKVPTGEHYEAIKYLVEYREFHPESFSAIHATTNEWTRNAHIKDQLGYAILFDDGGIVADLDTFWLKDITHLLDEDIIDIVVPRDTFDGTYNWPYNNCIMIGRKGSSVAMELANTSRYLLRQPWEVKWGSTGPVLLSIICKEYPENVKEVPVSIIGGYGGHDAYQLYEHNDTLPEETHVIHLYGRAFSVKYAQITPEWVKEDTCLLANIIRETLV